jgi:hypothetical protein
LVYIRNHYHLTIPDSGAEVNKFDSYGQTPAHILLNEAVNYYFKRGVLKKLISMATPVILNKKPPSSDTSNLVLLLPFINSVNKRHQAWRRYYSFSHTRKRREYA